MNILHESCLIASAPAELLVALAIFFCVSMVILLALSIEAGNYPELMEWVRRLADNASAPRREQGPDVDPHIWHAIAGGYGYDRAP